MSIFILLQKKCRFIIKKTIFFLLLIKYHQFAFYLLIEIKIHPHFTINKIRQFFFTIIIYWIFILINIKINIISNNQKKLLIMKNFIFKN